jgi:hypothetical protein
MENVRTVKITRVGFKQVGIAQIGGSVVIESEDSDPVLRHVRAVCVVSETEQDCEWVFREHFNFAGRYEFAFGTNIFTPKGCTYEYHVSYVTKHSQVGIHAAYHILGIMFGATSEQIVELLGILHELRIMENILVGRTGQ